MLRPPLAALLAAALCAAPASAQEAPLSKEAELEKFHPPAAGMDPATRLAGFAKRLEMEKASPLAGLSFRSVGPEIQGGRIVDIQGIGESPDSLLVAYATGGLWRTDNRGGSWTSLFDDQSSMTIGAIAAADDAGELLYLGSGEANSSRTSYAGTGVFKSEDGGKTWRNVGLSDCHHVGRIRVHPGDPNRVYVAAVGHLYTENEERGLYRSEDGGATWQRVLHVDERTGAIDVVLDPNDPQVVYAATWERARRAWNFLESGKGSGVWKSTDGGDTWTRLGGGLPEGASVGRIGLAVSASQPRTLYAVVDNQALRDEPADEETRPGELTPRRLKALTAEQFARLPEAVVARFLEEHEFPKKLKPKLLRKDVAEGRITIDDLVAYVKDANRDLFERPIVGPEVYRSDDAGASWRRTHEGRIDDVYYSYGYYFGRIDVDPRNSQRLYLQGVPFIGSTDGGATWRGLDRRGVHVDHHALWIDPAAPRRLALGNDGGLNLSFDGGETWQRISNLPVGQFTTLALDDAEPYHILGGLQDNGVLRGPSDYVPGKSDPASWREILGGDGSAVVVDPEDDDVVYTAYQFGHAFRLDLKDGPRKKIRPRPELSAEKKEEPLRYNWVSPFILSPHSNEILWFGANRLYRSFDRGETWTPVSDDLTSDREQGDVPFGTITSIAESPQTYGVLYVGTDEGRLWGTRDGGVTWQDLSRGLAEGRWVTRVVASVHDEGTVYVSQSGYRNDDFAPYLFRSTDFGASWTSLASELPAEPVNTVREDPEAKHLLYVGTDHGVFVSLDRGESFVPLASGLPRVPVHDLAVHPREGDLVLATHGRSVYVAEAAPLRELTEAAMDEPLAAFKIESVEADHGRGYDEHPYLTWFEIPPLVRIAYWLQGEAPVRLTIRDERGKPWRELEGPARPGLNVVEYDLTADPRLADAAAAAARQQALEEKREQEKEQAKQRAGSGEDPEAEDDEEDDEKKDEVLDPDLWTALADPLLATRERYLPPGRYTVEIRSGEHTATSKLVVKEPKKN